VFLLPSHYVLLAKRQYDQKHYQESIRLAKEAGGDRRLARTIAEEAISRTPNIFEPRRIYAEILLEERNFTKVTEVLNWMKDEVNAPEPGERRTNYRGYLETNARYLTEIGRFPKQKTFMTMVPFSLPPSGRQLFAKSNSFR